MTTDFAEVSILDRGEPIDETTYSAEFKGKDLKVRRDDIVEVVPVDNRIMNESRIAYVLPVVGVIIGFLITSSHGLYFHEMRVKGCTSVLKNYPNIHITDYAEAEDDEEVSYNEVKKMLLKNEKIDTLYFVTGGTTGGLRAIHDLHMENRLRVFTFDQIPAVIENLKSGLVIATIDQQPFVQGATSVRMLFEAIMTKQIPTRRQVFTELNIKNRYNITG